MMPLISAALSENNRALARKYIVQSMRYSLLLLLPVAVLMSVYSVPLVHLLYSDAYATAAPVLSILVFGFTLLSIFLMLCSVLSGAGKPSQATVLVFVLLVLSFVLTIVLVRTQGIVGAAIAHVVTAAVGCILVVALVYYYFHAVIPFFSLVRIVTANLVIFILGWFLQASGLYFILYSVLLGVLYVDLLALLGEITKKDFDVLLSPLTK